MRHGQASAGAADYDKLSERGHVQARKLGDHWATRGMTFDRVFVGPRRRHRETLEHVQAAYRDAGLALPDAVLLEGLDEHHGMAAVMPIMPQLVARDAEVAALARTATTPTNGWRLFRKVLRLWAEGELDGHPHEVERFGVFMARVRTAVEAMIVDAPKGARIAVFTSAGATAAAACHALHIDDGRAMDLSFELANASFTCVRFSGGRLSLSTLNETPHLSEELLTMV